MRRLLTALSLFLALLSGAARAEAIAALPDGPASPNTNEPGRAQLHAIFAQLNLSADQKSQLKALRQERAPEEKTARRELREAKHAFAAALAGEASEEQIRAAHQSLSQKREAIAAARFEGLLAVRRILSAEQRTQFDHLYIEYRHAKNERAAEQE